MRYRTVYFDGCNGARLGDITKNTTGFSSRNNDGLLENQDSDVYLIPLEDPNEAIHLITTNTEYSSWQEYVLGSYNMSREELEEKLRRKYPELNEELTKLIRSGQYDDTRIDPLQ